MPSLNVVVLCGSLQRPSRTQVLCQAILDELSRHRAIVPSMLEISQFGRTLGACLQRSELPKEILAHLHTL